MGDSDLRDLERRWADGQGEVAVGAALERALERAGAEATRRVEVRAQLLRRHLRTTVVRDLDLTPVPEVDPFTFLINVPGAGAISTWLELRALTERTGAYPLLVGPPTSAEDMKREICDRGPVQGVIDRALELTAVDPHEWSREQTRLMIDYFRRAQPDRDLSVYEAMLAPKPSPRVEEELSSWPVDVEALVDFTIPLSFSYDRVARLPRSEPHQRVCLLLLPSRAPWQAAAYVGFGNFNSCPKTHQHVAIHRQWFERWGAEPVGITRDVIEMRVERPPQTREDALRLAHEQLATAIDYDRAPMAQHLAARLLGAPVWHLWWD